MKDPISFRDDITIKIDENDIGFTLGARDFKGVQCVSYQNVTGCLSQGAHPGSYNGQDAYSDMLITRSDEEIGNIVRRLTPLECERLQGMPDDWSKYGINENGEVYELPDSARYRLQGNGIATPFWRWMMKRISAQYERTPTLGSLFDGQGSFPMIWEGINGKGSALWSSEIEKHAIAVAKYHFPDDN